MSYAIHRTHLYFRGTCHRPADGCLRDDRGAIVALETREDADRMVAYLAPRSPYWLSYGEYGSPSDRIVRSRVPARTLREACEALMGHVPCEIEHDDD